MSETGDISQIFIGAPVDVASERDVLSRIVRSLADSSTPSVILANFHIRGRQIDIVVATAQAVWVVEAKSSHLPVRGGINGMWSRQGLSGEWRDYTNAYQQTLAAKNAVRDGMSALKPIGDFYPGGQVVFASGIPPGSAVTPGDFKVGVSDVEPLLANFKQSGSSPWALDDWRKFAANHGLASVTLAQAIATEADQALELYLSRYFSAFTSEYQAAGKRWLDESPEQRTAVLEGAKAGAGAFVTGPSGCGKTLLAKWLALELTDEGHPVLFVAGKDFSGSWANVLRKELALLVDEDPREVLRAFRRAPKPIVILLDGINELGAHREAGVRGIAALARRLEAQLIVTGQERTPGSLDGLADVNIKRPSLGLKRRIAEATGGSLTGVAAGVLQAVDSGMEADIVGQIGKDLRANVTRLILVDQYVRMRLGDHARRGSLGLRRLATALHDQVAFSLPETGFDEFMRANDVSFDDVEAMFRVGVLVRRAGRVSFSHEMILNACAAFGQAANASADPENLGARLASPYLAAMAGDILSAIEDADTSRQILANVTRADLLASAAEGAYGDTARIASKALLDAASANCAEEIQSVSLTLTQSEGYAGVDWLDEGKRAWTDVEIARLSAVGMLGTSGVDVGPVLHLCAMMDERLLSERRRLTEQAREAKFALRSESFRLAYYGFGSKIGFSYVPRANHSPFGNPSRIVDLETSLLDMSSGQLLFCLENRRIFFDRDGQFAEELIKLFEKRFTAEPYHVKLSMLSVVGYAREAPADSVTRLIAAIEALDVGPTNWAINSSIIDALKMLGALDDEGEENRAHIRGEIDQATTADEEAADPDLAFSVYSRMFDHPFDSVYAEEIFALDEVRQRRLYRRAFLAYRPPFHMGEAWLADKVASFDDVADVALFQRFAGLPDPTNPMSQDEWTTFTIATRFLGKHGGALPEITGDSDQGLCLKRVRALVYALETKSEDVDREVPTAWQALHAMPVGLVIGCLGEINGYLTGRSAMTEQDTTFPRLNIADAYPEDCLRAARLFLNGDEEPRYYHRTPWREEGPAFAFEVIGRLGDRGDIGVLRRFTRAHRYAEFALGAIKALDSTAVT